MPEMITVPTKEREISMRDGEVGDPSIAVVIIARDSEEFILETLDSICAQSLPPNEVIVYDDGSKDQTAVIAEAYHDRIPTLRVVRGENPHGIAAARNAANGMTTCEYIAVLDSDDVMSPEAIRNYAGLLSNREIDLVYADTVVFREDPESGTRRNYASFSTASQGIRRILAAPVVPFKHSSVAYRRETFLELGGYDESFPIKVDVELFLRFLDEGKKVEKLDEIVSAHRKHRGQVSVKRLKGIRAYSRLLRRYEPNLLVRVWLSLLRYPAELLKMMLGG